METEEQARKSLKDNDGIDFPSVTKELEGIMGNMRAELDVDEEEEPLPLTQKERDDMKDFMPHVKHNFEQVTDWVDGLEVIKETTERDNLIKEMAFIPADYNYSSLMDDEMINFLQEKGENNRKAMYQYIQLVGTHRLDIVPYVNVLNRSEKWGQNSHC